MKDMGNLLAEGSGKGNKAIIGWVAFYVVMAIASFVCANIFGYYERTSVDLFRGTTVTTHRNDFIWFTFMALGVMELIVAPMIAIAIGKTHIKLYEGGIMGKGISKWFYLGDIRTFDFVLSYDQVSVDVNGGQIVVHGPGTHYKVYASNGPEIQQAIFQQKSQA